MSSKEGDEVIPVNARAKSITIVDRWPNFEVPSDRFGTVVRAEHDFVAIRMDDFIPGCESWNNEVQFTPEDCGEYWHGTTLDTVEQVFFYHFCLTGEVENQEEKHNGQK